MFKSKKLATLTSMLVIFGLLVTGCGSSSSNGGNTSTEEVKQVLTYNNQAEPENTDPAKATGAPDLTVINAVFEGLVRYGKDAEILPGAAKEWKISDDLKTYTFTLNDSKWSNGDPVTAQDFVFAWERVLNPNTAAEYAYQLYYLENGQAYNEGTITDFSQVGVKALDEKTLEVKLNAPAPQFLGLTAFGTLMPVNQKVVSAAPDAWASKAETYIGNGPFKITKWVKNQSFEFAKNDNYWDKDSVKLDTLIFTSVVEQSTEYSMYETGQIDFGDDPPLEEMERLINEGVVTVGPDLSTYYYIFNVEAKPFDDVKVRKALSMAIDREAIVKNVTKAGQAPAFAFVPAGFPDADGSKDFREVGGDYFKEDLAEAKKLLAEAGYPEGKGFPKVDVLLNDSESHIKIASALIEMWKSNLGIDTISVKSMEWGTYLNARDEGDFQVARAGWGADYLDPMTFIDIFTSTSGNNDTNWGNKDFDAAIAAANVESDMAKRIEYMHQAEKIMMDDMIIIPIYFYTNPYYVQSYVKDYLVPSFGPNVEFKWAYVEKH